MSLREPGLPDLLDGFVAWQMLARAITELTALSQIEDDPYSATTAASAQHRVFAITPGDREYLGRMAPDDDDDDERDIVIIKQRVDIQLRHDYDPGAHADSYRVASGDLDALEIALLTHPLATRILQPELIASKPKREGHTLTHTLEIFITYERLMPPILE